MELTFHFREYKALNEARVLNTRILQKLNSTLNKNLDLRERSLSLMSNPYDFRLSQFALIENIYSLRSIFTVAGLHCFECPKSKLVWYSDRYTRFGL